MRDISSYEDLLVLIRKFYDKLLADEQIGHFFTALDLNVHIPKVADFWAFILLDQTGYRNNMMSAHAHLNLNKADFTQWLLLFHATIRENHSGEKAELAIERSQMIALTMESKLFRS
ncbi:MAG: group III truncated hemoglobin [Bacteroidota bacterium]|jgi:hemoglobin